jgi:hypothetical protein
MADTKKPTPEQRAATKKTLDAFHEGFAKSLKDERAELEALPKTHRPEAGEFVEDVDPAKAD